LIATAQRKILRKLRKLSTIAIYCNAKFGALFFLARFVPLRESIRFWLRLSRAPGSVVVFREVLGERARYV
jgi:hypothetical protein